MDNLQRERVDNLKKIIELMADRNETAFRLWQIQQAEIELLAKTIDSMIAAKFSDN